MHPPPSPARRLNVLFVCSRNRWRSRTAEVMYRDDPRFRVRSAGTAASARTKVSAGLLAWADVVFVMEDRHGEILTERFGTQPRAGAPVVLGIEDEYRYMDRELVDMLRADVEAYFAARAGAGDKALGA